MILNVEYRKTGDLTPYANNSRTHSDEQVKEIATSIKEFGFTNPILVGEDDIIIAGHGRLMAAKSLGIEEVPTIPLLGLSELQRQAYVIADNKLALNAGWNTETLLKELEDIELKGFDVSLTGFSVDEIKALVPEVLNKGLTDEDAVPELKPDPITKLGDVWLCGNHRLMCGDSTSIDAVEKLMNGQKAELLFTSPPYSDMRDYNGSKDLSVDSLVNFITTYSTFTEYQAINLGIQRKEHSIVQYWDEYIKKAKDCGYKFLSWNVWCKDSAGSIGNQSAFFPIAHEWIFVFGNTFKDINRTEQKKVASVKSGNTRTIRQKDGSMLRASVGRIEEFKELESWHKITVELGAIRKDHPATFPVLLPEKYIISMTNQNQNVIEPFCGSGTTLIACEKTGRVCFGMELDERYCDVIIKRWQDFTGKEATLESTDNTFNSYVI